MKKSDLFKCLGLFFLIIIFFNLFSCKKNKREGLDNEVTAPPIPKLEPTPTTPETAKVSSEFPIENKKQENKKNTKPNSTPQPNPEPPPPHRPIIQKVVKKIVKKQDRCSDLEGTCGGKNWFGPFCCNEGVCHKHDKFYSQCIMKNK